MLKIDALDDGAPKNPEIYRTRPSFCAADIGAISPARYVQQILGEEDESGPHVVEHPPLFLEMEELIQNEDGEEDEEFEWRETARWVKFEENVEMGGNRWSKPHVGTLSLHSLFEIRSFLLNNTVMLDLDAMDMEEVTDQVLDKMISTGHLSPASKAKFRETLLKPHTHLHQKHKRHKRHSGKGSANLAPVDSQNGLDNSTDRDKDGHGNKGNSALMRKIPSNSEACNILVAEVDFLEKAVSAFVRLSQAVILGDLTEVPVPTRFVFIIFGPLGGIKRYHEMGRAIATLLSDEVFHDVAYMARHRGHLLAGADEFLDVVTVLPPAKWDPSIRIEPPAAIPSQDPRKHPDQPIREEMDEEKDEEKLRLESGLVRTGKLFGGLVNDIKRKRRWYLSDFKDGLATQCIASSIFLYLGCLTPIITFGGLLGKATHQNMAAMESLVSGFVCGIVYGFFSGQPLTILGSTGPVMVFETVVVQFCDAYELNYLELRLWIGLWMGLIFMILVALDASAFVCYITRFTEENFATLIAVIFIVEAFKNVDEIRSLYPINPQAHHADGNTCECRPGNSTQDFENVTWTTVAFDECTGPPYNGTLVGGGCGFYPDIFLLSVLLFLGTFFISVSLKNFKVSSFFPSRVRQLVSDFAVIIAILSMTGLDMLAGLRTPKLTVPEQFAPTLPTRDWVVMPFNENPTWTVFGALLPAMLATILIFMDQQITAVIVNRKEHKLKKGCGYHLDLLVLGVLIIICSFLGIPWFVAATVRAMNHVDSLKMESRCAAPGEKPKFLGVREQRCTQIIISLLIGLSVVITPVLKNIPMPVLYGVFLFMGFTGLKGMQFFDRILLMFMPTKYQPDYIFLREVPVLRVHLFTVIQLACLIILWLIKSFKSTSILFPVMLVVMIIVRKLLDHVFSQRELKSLDDIMPNSTKPKKEGDDVDEELDYETGSAKHNYNLTVPSSFSTIPGLGTMNITEELNRTGLWKQIDKDNARTELPARKGIGIKIQRNSKDAISDDERKQLAVMTEEEEVDSHLNGDLKTDDPPWTSRFRSN